MRSAVVAGLVLLAGCGQEPAKPPSPSPETSKATIVSSHVSAVVHPSAPLVPPPPGLTHFQALGTEPFWSIDVAPGKLAYSSPEVQPAVAIAATFLTEGKKLRFSGTMDGKPVVLTIEPGTCSDGMSDTVYAYKATFRWGGQTEQGCARLK